MQMERAQAVERMADWIGAIALPHPLRVGIDGASCSGKTTLAGELADHLTAAGRTVITASIDGFHHPREVRVRRGPLCPRGYYEDSFDYPAITRLLLEPFGLGGDRKYKPAQFDFVSEDRVEQPWRTAPDDAILLFEGVMLQRPELAAYLDYTVYVDTTVEVTLARALERDAERLGGQAGTRQRYLERYIPGQQMYVDQCEPRLRANVVMVNDDLARPTVLAR